MTHVLICGPEDGVLGPLFDGEFIYSRGPVEDAPAFDIRAHFDAAFAFIASALEGGGKVSAPLEALDWLCNCVRFEIPCTIL